MTSLPTGGKTALANASASHGLSNAYEALRRDDVDEELCQDVRALTSVQHLRDGRRELLSYAHIDFRVATLRFMDHCTS